MADSFGLKIGLEGEKEFKKALADINQSFKVLGSEMKLATSQFDKNDKSMEALTARNKVLNKEIEAQKQKIETLRSALKNAADSFGENDRRTQNWQIQLNNAEAALNDMNRELDKNEKAIKDGGKAAEESGSKFEGFGNVLKTVGAAMGAVAVAAGAAAVKLGKEVIAAYADYEQLVGGVDTLFKDSSQEIQRYAANAYKTAGLSANEYMETVTGFSASLIQSLGGDTEKAAKYADMAITDMSDNANKMGTDMSSIQNAYQGFAKQNYTMLDNLKLGYGGTKQEMERLLADAEKISGVKYDISSYADVVEAIHVMQESMDIAGTTAKEAEATISGSVNALKSAVSNLIVGFGDADADMELLCNNMVDAFKTVVANITPVIENIVAALPTALDALLTAVGELLPTLLEAVTELFSQVLETLLSLLPQLIPAAVSALMTIVNTLIENLPLLIEAAVQLVSTLVTGIADALPTLIPAAVQAIVTIVQGLVDSLPMLLDAALQLITGFAQGLLDAIPVLIAALPEIINGIITFLLDSIPQIIETGIQLLTSLVTALPEIITAIVEAIPKIIDGIITAVLNAIPQIIQAGIDLLISLIQALPQIITTIVQAIPQIISGIVNALVGNIDKIIMAGVKLFVALIRNNPEWEFVDIYSDEGITGTSIKNRDGFNRMIDDALAGKIDLILTKSVSRFARNTVDSLTTVRKLKEKGIEVYFEKENIYTLDAKGELLITIMSSLAQEESRSISQNTTWGQRKRFADGKMSLAYSNFLGYRRGAELGDMEIVEEEAVIVRRIYSEFLAGKTPYDIAKHLTEDGIPTPMGKPKWHTTVIESILKNEKYKGDALLQKTVTTDFLTHTHKRNEGEAPQFYVEKNHPAIVRPEVFEMVQEEFRRRKAAGGRMQSVSIFSGRIVCEDCGGFYGRKVWHSTSEKYRAYHWHCNNKFQKRCLCQTPTLKEESIEQAFLSAINSLIKKKKEIRENYALCLDAITDDSTYVARLEEINAECCRLQEETKSLLTAAGRKNGGGLSEVNRQYEDYLAKFEGLQKEKSELSTQISKCAAKRVQVSSFLEELQKYDGPLKEFDPLIWQATLNHAVVHKNCTITFVFRDGTEVTRKIKNGVRKYVKRKASDPDNSEPAGEKE